MNQSQFVALLGRRDSPTDGVEDYCHQLRQALEQQGATLTLEPMPWAEVGWLQALQGLWQRSGSWRDQWVIVQYTASAWSKRAFPLGFLLVLGLLRWRCRGIAIVFHDPRGYFGERWVDHLRRACQHWVMGIAYAWADRSVFTVQPSLLPWLPPHPLKTVLIPVGSNIPEPPEPAQPRHLVMDQPRTIAVFGITGGANTANEVGDIAAAARSLRPLVPGVRIVACGRDSAEAAEQLQTALGDLDVDLTVRGLLPAAEVAQILAASDLLLFVRGQVSSGRTSAIAGIACRVPVVAYEGPLTAPPITEAGCILVPLRDRPLLAQAVTQVLTDPQRWDQLYEKNCTAMQQHFAWQAIANQFLKAFAVLP